MTFWSWLALLTIPCHSLPAWDFVPSVAGSLLSLEHGRRGGVEQPRSSPQPSPSQSQTNGCPFGKGMMLRVGICPPWSCKCLIQELDHFFHLLLGVHSPAKSLSKHRAFLSRL